jgi:DNA mismatch endonuclease (patch repair protein)
VRSKGTGLEARFANLLAVSGLPPFERHPRDVYGRPDLVFRSRRVAVFVDSCFWHGCQRHLRMPTRNVLYWQQKIRRNRARDRAVKRSLEAQGWKVLRLWEHQLERLTSRRRVVLKLACSLADMTRDK